MTFPPKNLCFLDRLVRGVVGVATTTIGLLGSTLIGEPIVQGILIIFGAANLVSLATGWCMVYHVAGLSTAK